MNSFITAIVVIFGVVGLFVVYGLLLSIPVWLLWNGCLVGAVAGVSEISLLQALGITILTAILFKPVASSK